MATAKKRTVAKTSALDKKFSQRTRATEKHYIPNYPTKLFIYKQAASKYWWVRYFVNGNAVRKTTKTESKREAIAFAKSFYDTVTYNQRHGISATLSATSFAACLKEMLKAEKAKLDRGEISKITFDNSVYRYEKSITPFFGKMEVKDIDYMCVDRYLNQLSTLSLSASTITAYLGLTRKVLSYAARRRLIASVPEFPSVRLNDKPRGWFTWSEYIKLWHAAGRLAGKKIQVRKYYDDLGEKQTQSVSKSAGPVAMPSLKISAPPLPSKASDAKAADADAQLQKSAQQKAAPQGQGPLPRLGVVQAAKTPAMQQVLPAQLPSSVAKPQTLSTALPPVQTARPTLSARRGGLVAGDTPI